MPFFYRATMQSVDPARNRYREYVLEAKEDLFGGFAVSTWRARIGRPGQRRDQRHTSRLELEHELARILLRRVQHGYHFLEQRFHA